MAHTKAQRAVKGNRDSHARRLGIKKYGGEAVIAGNIILTQKGTRYFAGEGTMLTNDFTIQALKTGKVEFVKNLGKTYICVV